MIRLTTNFMKLALFIFIVLISVRVEALASEFEIKDGKLFFQKNLVPTNFIISLNRDKNEVRTLFSASTRGNYSVIKVISVEGEVEFLLFSSSEKSFRKLAQYPINLATVWLTDDIFLFRRKHMGTSVSILNIVRNDSSLLSSDYIKELFAFDVDKNLMFSMEISKNNDTNHKIKVSSLNDDKYIILPMSEFFSGVIDSEDIFLITFEDCFFSVQSEGSKVVETYELECHLCKEMSDTFKSSN